jgi:hypothetical protein
MLPVFLEERIQTSVQNSFLKVVGNEKRGRGEGQECFLDNLITPSFYADRKRIYSESKMAANYRDKRAQRRNTNIYINLDPQNFSCPLPSM